MNRLLEAAVVGLLTATSAVSQETRTLENQPDAITIPSEKELFNYAVPVGD